MPLQRATKLGLPNILTGLEISDTEVYQLRYPAHLTSTPKARNNSWASA